MWTRLWSVLCMFVVEAQYEVPDATVEALSPRGFRVSIPDEEGISLFAFHGKINEEMNGREAGTFSRDILKAKNGRWTFYDPTTKLKVGDILYYWTYVDYFDGRNKLGYPKDDQSFVVTELIEQTTTPSKPTNSPTPITTSTSKPVVVPSQPTNGACDPSPTTYNGRTTCKGKLLFSEAFTTEIRKKFWTVEQKFAGAPDYEFVVYVNRPETVFIRNRMLRIKPELADNVFGTDFVTSPYDLGENCTGVPGSQECKVRPDAGFILPPVLSAQITTKRKFSFKYGQIEIRAKLPKGDWIYPELYLNSVNDNYGAGYDSGQIRIAFTPGNDAFNTVLRGGIILGSCPAARNYGMKSVEKVFSWTKEFHRFQITWKPDSIVVGVDDKVYGSIYPPNGGFSSLGADVRSSNGDRWKAGSELAPFDKEMFFTIGVGVGGFNFEEKSDGTKPWRNGERLSMKKFYRAQEMWKQTWDEDSMLSVDAVKVWAL